jgi:hypothetical protein
MEVEEFNASFNSLYENISYLDQIENKHLIIIDLSSKTLENENLFTNNYEFIQKLFTVDKSLSYLFFMKKEHLEKFLLTSKNEGLNNFSNIIQENVFVEEKISYMFFIIGYAIAKNINVYVFTDRVSEQWIKIKDKFHSGKLKFSEYEFLKVTIEYLTKENKNSTKEGVKKEPSKLTMLLNSSTGASSDNINNVNSNSILMEKKVTNLQNSNLIKSTKFQSITQNIKNYIQNSIPKDFLSIKKIIFNFAEQNITVLNKLYNNLNEEELSFLIFKELLNQEIIFNTLLRDLVNENVIKSFSEVEKLLSFLISSDSINTEKQEKINKEVEYINTILKSKKKRKNKNRVKEDSITPLILSANVEEEYKSLLLNVPSICNFNRDLIKKILDGISIPEMHRLPTSPNKFQNYILSLVNNQELYRISKKLVHIDYDKIVNILTEGVILELVRNNLICFLSSTKMTYNLEQIEKEKFRLKEVFDIKK